MAETQPFPLQALCYTAGEFREGLAAQVCGEGVVDVHGGDLLVASTGSDNHSVTVAAGSAFVFNNDATGERQMYRVLNDASVTIQLPAGGGGNPRVDTIIATVQDDEYGGGSDNWVLTSVDGTPNASAALTDAGITASAAAVPDNSIVLAYVLVADADTLTTIISGANILDARNNYLKCGAPPSVRLTASAATTGLSSGVTTKVDLATTAQRDRDYFSVSSSVVTILQAGLYDVSGFAALSGAPLAGSQVVGLGLNGLTNLLGQVTVQGNTLRATPVVQQYPLAVNDTIRLAVAASGTAPLATAHDAATGLVSRLVIRKVG